MKLAEGIKDNTKNVFKHRRSRMTVGSVDCRSTKGALKKGESTAEKISESFHQCSLWRRAGRFPSSHGMRWRNCF